MHKQFKAQAQSGWSDHTVEVLPIPSAMGFDMVICAKEGPVYITKAQVIKFFGFIDPAHIRIKLVTSDGIGSQYVEAKAIETEDDGSTTIVIES